MVDLELLNSPEDVKCDGLGSWLNRSNVSTKFNYDGKIISDSKPYNCEIKTTYFTHRHFNNSKRRLIIVKLNEKPKYALLLYKHEGGCKITDQAHGNSKTKQKFTRTMPSTFEKAREGVKHKQPQDIYIESIRDAGGPTGIRNDTSVIRNVQQIYNINKSIKQAIAEDELMWLIKQKNKDQSAIRAIHLTKTCNLGVFIATDFQLNMLEKHCVGYKPCILGIDMTYNCGDFYVTPTTIQHPFLIHSTTLVEPVILGPTFIHTEHNQSVYELFASDIINVNKNLKHLKFLGSDRQLEVYNGFEVFMPDLQLMICKKHVQDNIERFLKSKSLSGAFIQDVMDDIFLELCTALDDEHFEEMLEEVKDKWDKINTSIHPWFVRYQSKSFKECMTQVKRQAAGLGTKFYYNNANESANDLIKTGITRKSTLPDVLSVWEKVVNNQQVNCELSVVDMGNYRLKAAYSNLKVERTRWFKMTKLDRQSIIDGLFKNPGKKTRLNVMEVAQENRKKNATGRKPNQSARKQVSRSIEARFCNEDKRHETDVYFVKLGDHPRVRICYSCRSSLLECEKDTILAVTKTYRKYFDKSTLKMVFSKLPRKVYVHLKCSGHADFKSKPFHVCNYMHPQLDSMAVAEITKHGILDI